MVPITLQLQNFLSYADPGEPLDFRSFQTACLCGNNGHGKSALLDALTWALWGKARHDSGSLMRIGASDMRIEFVFDLDGERYRVTRGYTRNKRGGTPLLEVNIADPESGLFRPLTRSSVRESQALLDSLLRMDYETFINSAYLRQGMADRFSRQMPGDRKRILAEILGLSRYQEIADRARGDARQEDTKVAQLEGQIEAIENYLSGREEAQRLYDFYDDALKQLRPKIDALQKQFDETTTRKIRLDEARKRAEKLANEIALEERKREELQATRGRLLAQKAEVEEWQVQSETIVGEYNAFREAEAERRKWEAIAEKWQSLAEQGRAIQEKIRDAKAVVERDKSGLEARLAQEQRVLEQSQARIARAGEVQEGAKLLEAARAEEATLGQQRAAFDAAQRELHEAQNALRNARNQLDVRLHQLENQVAELQTLVARREAAQQVLEEAQAQVAKLHEAQQTIDALQDERIGYESRIAQLKQHVEAAKADIAAQEQKLRVLLANPQAQCPLCNSQLGEHGRDHIQENIEDDVLKLKDRIEEYTQEARLLQKKKTALDEPVQNAQAVLRDAQRLHAAEARARGEVERIEDAAKRLEPLQKELDKVQASLSSGDFAPDENARFVAAQEKLAGIEYSNEAHEAAAQRVRELARFESEIAALQLAQSEAQAAEGRIAELQPQLRAIEASLESGDYAADDRREVARLKAQAEALGYDAAAKDAFRLARETCDRLQNATSRYERYKAVLSRSGEVEAEVAHNVSLLEENAKRVEALRKEGEGLRDVVSQMGECERLLSGLQSELGEARENERELSTELGRQRGTLEECERRAAERQQLDEKRKVAAREAFVLKKTAEAFGKDGIQALIIENAIPEIQDHANEILRRLTSNRMQIALESQREKKSGGTSETLDIKISDERGTREYSLFSGGEAFRADFALRIALSKLLARRAGTQLRTLIIDEGFGTQDSEGLQQMIECIQAISDDFEKVLVVTHLDVIKNAFPTRIEVAKDPVSGSNYRVVG